MCGIVGYIGRRDATPVLIQGLKRLEYRGYDSFGIATVGSAIEVYKKTGRISDGESGAADLRGYAGIGHTRWATHGEPSDLNAHPHTDCSGRIAVVHNGVIENYGELKRQLAGRGHTFRSETDTEVIAHLIEEHYDGDLLAAVNATLPLLKGSYAVLVIAEDTQQIVAARDASPLVLGVGDGEVFAASDMTPLLEYTERVIFLEDGDVADLASGRCTIYHDGQTVERPIELINWCVEDTRKGGFAHYMLKEIYEQPQSFYETIRAGIDEHVRRMVTETDEITLVACGTSYHTALVFKYLAEPLCGIPVRVEMGSEFKYFTPPLRGLVIAVSQSGETADTIAALKMAKARNCPTLAITNMQGSTVTRVADETLLMRAGPEIGVAATKSYTAQLAALMEIVNLRCEGAFDDTLSHAHLAIGDVLLQDIKEAVALCSKAEHVFFVGRGPFYPVSMEGALKMKEISYVHAEGYAAGELKHGPFALLTPETPVVAVCTPGSTYGVMTSNIKEMKARKAPVIALGVAGDTELAEIVDIFIPIPNTHHLVQVLTASVVLQLLAYHTACALQRDVDKPRNLAKSVTVE
ncbi:MULTISPECIES: glutamine--fructose-6-phosphate transaminase (isomerizing) [Methanoculleus]|uniref:Glutamine--fructose-6-phosphate aminotransferase [isomerizing] n=2 Tax=Methanoculleus TaxID=45989 RepID=A3CXQ4_METMJ|nr:MULTISPECIES: glutamine--fructose-6-phosphate transaminase (isomerizing) [Methanoculleus]ABN58154.1 glutamine--fructose-6-phosphate transaminase [Methanoculleus marisnigri JR1]MCC7554819.1 glutamine--fructose-6-phosphate transaminase (isomerizing) [Methanoculleus marisnigri]UYU19535.1 glutamine--fructose-6-phosphate transaminase (isomerizing) [Methanoculleus submarinus]